jgi:RHS repeat-associated protein
VRLRFLRLRNLSSAFFTALGLPFPEILTIVAIQCEVTKNQERPALQAAFGLTAGGSTDAAFQSVQGLFGGGPIVGTAGYPYEDSGAPKAYINYILFDQDFVPYDFGYNQLSTAAGSAPERLTLKARPRKAGYLYVYLSNENPTIAEVFFDDFRILNVRSPVLQYMEYYPYGMQTSASWTRDNNQNNYLYNGGSEYNSNSQFYETFFRNYDPILGRFTLVDPAADKYAYINPYNYAFNDPVFHSDPNGDDAGDPGRGFNWWAYRTTEDGKRTPIDGGGGMFGLSWRIATYGGGFARFGPGDGGALGDFATVVLAMSHYARERREQNEANARAVDNLISQAWDATTGDIGFFYVEDGQITKHLLMNVSSPAIASAGPGLIYPLDIETVIALRELIQSIPAVLSRASILGLALLTSDTRMKRDELNSRISVGTLTPDQSGNKYGHSIVGITLVAQKPLYFELHQPKIGDPYFRLIGSHVMDLYLSRGLTFSMRTVTELQADGALGMAYGQSSLGPRPYDYFFNSCVSSVKTVLMGAGIIVPFTVLTPSQLMVWFGNH